MTDFAKSNHLPVVNENCPACFEEPKERARIKKLLSREETLYPNIHDKIRRALIPIMHDDMTSILKSYTEEALAKSRKDSGPGKKNKKRKQQNDADGSPPLKKSDNEESSDDKESGVSDAKKQGSLCVNLAEASDDQLLRELANRRAAKFKTYGAMKTDARGLKKEEKEDNLPEDLTGQVCTIDGANGSIRCYELME